MFAVGVGVIHAGLIYAEILASVPIKTAPIILIVVGIVSLINGGIVIYIRMKTLTSNEGPVKPLLIALAIFLAISVVLAFCAGGYGIRHSKELKEEFGADLMQKIQVYGRTKYSMKDVDELQREFKCCGVHSYADWRATIYGGHRYDKVPDSCCKKEKYQCGVTFENLGDLNREGCAAIVTPKASKLSVTVGVIGIIDGLIEVLYCVVVVYVYCKCVRVDEQPPPSSPNEPDSGPSTLTGHKSTLEDDKPSAQAGAATSAGKGEKPSKQQSTYC